MGNAFLCSWMPMFISSKDPWLVKQDVSRVHAKRFNSHASADDLVHEPIFYAEWGRKIIHVPVVAYYDKFPGLRSHIKSVTNSTPDGHGTHDCLVNRRTGLIIGITYNNRPEKRAILEEILPMPLADIIMDYAFPTHPSQGLKPWMTRSGASWGYQPSCYINMSRIEGAHPPIKLKMAR